MNEAMISIKGLLGPADDGDEIELVTDGDYSFSDGAAKFRYTESELTGMDGTETEFLVEPGRVTITRRGTVAMQMVFEEGQRNYFVYDTPFGSMTMGVDTHSILSTLGDRGGSLEVKYLMDLGSSMTTRNRFEINIKI